MAKFAFGKTCYMTLWDNFLGFALDTHDEGGTIIAY